MLRAVKFQAKTLIPYKDTVCVYLLFTGVSSLRMPLVCCCTVERYMFRSLLWRAVGQTPTPTLPPGPDAGDAGARRVGACLHGSWRNSSVKERDPVCALNLQIQLFLECWWQSLESWLWLFSAQSRTRYAKRQYLELFLRKPIFACPQNIIEFGNPVKTHTNGFAHWMVFATGSTREKMFLD